MPSPSKAKNATKEEAAFIKKHQDALSKTTQRAKWVHSPDEHEDYPGQSLATQQHEVIQHWAEERQAIPATVPSGKRGRQPRVLRFDFPGYGGESLETIQWDDWFKPFDQRHLVFLFQEHNRDGKPSNFFKLDSPERKKD